MSEPPVTRPALIQVVGSLNVDLVTVTPRVPGPGETINATSFSSGFGGKGANQAVAAARLLRNRQADDAPEPSVDVHMLGAVGDDQFGRDYLTHLATSESINVDGILVKRASNTGTAVICVEEGSGENRIMFTTGANGLLTADDVNLSTSGPTGYLKRITLFQLETPLPTVVECIKRSKKLGNQVILNPAPAAEMPDTVFQSIDHLIMNESEASFLSGVPEERLADSLDVVADTFFDKGVGNVVITLGSKGAFCRTKNEKKGILVPTETVVPVDTTAAGDTFVGAYAVFLAKHDEDHIEAGVRFACIAGAKAVTKAGAQTSMPYLSDISM